MDKKLLKKMHKDYKEHKEEYKEMFKEATDNKIKSCTKPNGEFDYLEMSRLWHKGKW